MSTTTLVDSRAAAEHARRVADDAASKAAAAERAAEQAAAKAAAEEQARLRADAQRFVDRFDTELAAATTALNEARITFNTIAVEGDSLTAVRDRYLHWQAASMRPYLLHLGLQGALGRLEKLTWRGVAIPAAMHQEPPPFSKALDAAIETAITQRNVEAEDAFFGRLTDDA